MVDVGCRELLGQNPENIRRLMQLTVANELSPTRSPNNMLLITVVFQQSPDLAAKVRLLVVTSIVVHCSLWSPYVIGQTIIFLPCDFYLLSSSFFSLPNLSGWRLDVYHTSTHCVALVQI